VCFLLTIPIFVGYYVLFVLVCHGIKTGLYAYFKSHRKEWNSIADREEMKEHIAQNLGQIQKRHKRRRQLSPIQKMLHLSTASMEIP